MPSLCRHTAKFFQVGVPGCTPRVVFVATADNVEHHRRPFAFDLTDCVGNPNQDGSGTLSWRNRSTEAIAIKVQFRKRDGTWKTLAILPPGTTTVTIPAAWVDN